MKEMMKEMEESSVWGRGNRTRKGTDTRKGMAVWGAPGNSVKPECWWQKEGP